MKKSTIFILILVFIAAIGSAMYWFLYTRTPGVTKIESLNPPVPGFAPFNKEPLGTISVTSSSTVPNPEEIVQSIEEEEILPKLRHLSLTPVGGMSASSTMEGAVVRFVDRGTGYIYEADSASSEIVKISNTTIPKIQESYWNKNLTSMILRYVKDESDTITSLYAELRPTTTTASTTTLTPFEIKGRYLSQSINQIAVSPMRDKIFTWNLENGRGIGYISTFDEKSRVKVIDTPITQTIIDWPESNTLSFTTKASANASGYTYLVDTKTGSMKKALGGIRGLFSKVNGDKTKILYSEGSNNNITLSIFVLKDGSSQEVLFRTLADKCIWSNLRKNELYCSVPTEIPQGIYPDDWYKGSVSFVDQIWHLDTSTGEVHLLANLLDLSDELIDAVDLTLDIKENVLYFINKRDLTLWSLDLNQ